MAQRAPRTRRNDPTKLFTVDVRDRDGISRIETLTRDGITAQIPDSSGIWCETCGWGSIADCPELRTLPGIPAAWSYHEDGGCGPARG